jgi:hypothetical protein
LKADILPDDSQAVRQRFWVTYTSASKLMSQWLRGLPQDQTVIYQQFTLPPLSRFLVEGLTRNKEVTQRQQQIRKAETDAVVPRFWEIRAEAHFRFNRVARLQRAYQDALRTLNTETHFPVVFSYEEGGDREKDLPAQERLWFRIWDRRSFVLAHADAYSYGPVNAARRGVGTFADDVNHIFLEFVRAKRLYGDAPAEGFWFNDLFRRGVLGLNPFVGSAEEVKAKQAWLASWGYGSTPFFAEVAGLLTWPVADGRFMASAQRRTGGVLLPVDALYSIVTFGLMAIDLFTTTGARINEVMQIRLTEDCIVRLKMPPPPESKDQSSRLRYNLRLVPKGVPKQMRLQHHQASLAGLEHHAVQVETHARGDCIGGQVEVSILKQVRRLPKPLGATV